MLVTVSTVVLASLVSLLASVAVARHRRPPAFPWYYAAVVLTAATLPGAVALDWSQLPTPTRVAFVALGVLAVVLVVEAENARRCLPYDGAATTTTQAGRFVDSVGFTVVALLDAFAVVTAVEMGAPGWAMKSSSQPIALRPILQATRVLMTVGPSPTCRLMASMVW